MMLNPFENFAHGSVCPVQAIEAAKTAKLKRCYFDWADQLRMNPGGNVPYTPVLPLLYGMKESLALINSEGIDNVIARHHRCTSRTHGPYPGGRHAVDRSTVIEWSLLSSWNLESLL